MDRIKQKLNSAKETVVRNKTKILGTTTAVLAVAVVIQARGNKLHNDFLKERGLFDEYYYMAEDED